MHTCVDAHSGAVFRSGEDAPLRRCVHASTRRRKRAQGRRYDAEIKQLFWAPVTLGLVHFSCWKASKSAKYGAKKLKMIEFH